MQAFPYLLANGVQQMLAGVETQWVIILAGKMMNTHKLSWANWSGSKIPEGSAAFSSEHPLPIFNFQPLET